MEWPARLPLVGGGGVLHLASMLKLDKRALTE